MLHDKWIEPIKENISNIINEVISNFSKNVESLSNKYGETFEDLENMEIVGNTIIYSDRNLPRMGSQILMAQMRGYKPYE